ncbi:hypothetical protein EJ08DRAFT_698637 [Tothia fuscella]|uniref:Uncharacterized protein n=1 Tax=Tothia fuscella TaxID=1048955 RepID=A0A9P4NPR2_9PEZI|nr:hypothetical protein EJ08DRAFT_698637 [Tothia fuscella]
MQTPYLSFYDASKAAITMWSDTIQFELALLGVTVVTVMVGMVETNKSAEKWIEISSTAGQGNLKQYEMGQDKFAEKISN